MKLATKCLGGVWCGMVLYYWWSGTTLEPREYLSLCFLFGVTVLCGMIAVLDEGNKP